MSRSCISVTHHLASAASVAVSSPALSASICRSTNTQAMSSSVFISASSKRVFWNEAMVCPNAVRSPT